MRHLRLISTLIVATAFVAVGALAPYSVPAQAPGQPKASAKKDAKKDAAPKPGPYQTVAVQPPAPLSDASLDAFRKQLGAIAQKKDRAALAQLVAANFFLIQDDKDIADKNKPGIDNLAKAITLAGKDAFGWEVLFEAAADTSGAPDPQRQGVVCAPAHPSYDEKAFQELVKATRTFDWVYPANDALEVRSGPQERAAVIEKLGLHLVRSLDPPGGSGGKPSAFSKILTPSGKTGYVPADALRDAYGPQLCYVKDAGGWKIAGILGFL